MGLKAIREASKEFDTYTDIEIDRVRQSIQEQPLETTLRRFPKIAKIISWALQIVAVFPIGRALKIIITALILVFEGIANEKMKQ